MLGLKRGTVKLIPYQSQWKDEFEKEKQYLLKIIKSNIAIEHIGSTSVEGLTAKPIIDIIIGYNSTPELNDIVVTLKENSYEDREENAVEGEHLFVKGTADIRTHHLHVIKLNSEIWDNYITFRNYLRKHHTACVAYNRLKVELTNRFASDRQGYTNGKTDFIRNTLRSRKENL